MPTQSTGIIVSDQLEAPRLKRDPYRQLAYATVLSAAHSVSRMLDIQEQHEQIVEWENSGITGDELLALVKEIGVKGGQDGIRRLRKVYREGQEDMAFLLGHGRTCWFQYAGITDRDRRKLLEYVMAGGRLYKDQGGSEEEIDDELIAAIAAG